jgi:misacylated tRNA(Ala) deacylase
VASGFSAGELGRAMTELAYLPDMSSAYVRSFRARVESRPPGAVVLDRTYFYPAGGGQPGDRGTLRLADGTELRVVDVAKYGPSVLHRLKTSATPRLDVGTEVEGTLDWERRHRHMRLHTTQHFLSARIFTETALRTRKAVLGGNRATIDLEGPLSEDQVPSLVESLRVAVAEPRPVTIRFIPRAEWDRNPVSERSGLVPLPPQVDPVRVIEIEGWDTCPCGGTHLRTTAEIGRIALDPLQPLPDGASRVAFTLADAVPSTPDA